MSVLRRWNARIGEPVGSFDAFLFQSHVEMRQRDAHINLLDVPQRAILHAFCLIEMYAVTVHHCSPGLDVSGGWSPSRHLQCFRIGIRLREGMIEVTLKEQLVKARVP